MSDDNEKGYDDDPGGPLTDPNVPRVHYNFRAMLKYCEEVGKDTSELTDEELEPFVTGIDPPLSSWSSRH